MKIFPTRMLLLLALSYGVATVQSCKEEALLQPNRSGSDEVLESIKAAGFTDIQEMGDYFIAEGDIYFSKNEIYQTQEPASNGRTAHYRARNIVSEPYNVTVRVDATIPTTGVDNWRNALTNAMTDWNTLESTNIFFILTTSSSAEVTITSDNGALANNVLATSTLPNASGAPGSTIRINLDYNNNQTITESQKRYQLVHELGHTLGIRHTDWETIGELRDGAVHVPNTPTGINDVSIMTSFQRNGLKNWDGWREYDPMTAQYLFPQPHLYAINGGDLYAINELSGASYRIGTEDFTDTPILASLYGYETRLYVIKDGSLFKIHRKTGKLTRIGTSGAWNDTKAMTATGGLSLGGNQLYVLRGNALRHVNPNDGTFALIGGQNDWDQTYLLSSFLVSPSDGVVAQGLFAIYDQNGFYGVKVPHSIHSFPGNSFTTLIKGSPINWAKATAMVCIPDTRLNYIIIDGSLYKAEEFSGGSFRQVGVQNDWTGEVYMAFYKRNLYIVRNGTLYEFNTANNTKRQIGNTGAWNGTTAIVGAPNNVTNPQ